MTVENKLIGKLVITAGFAVFLNTKVVQAYEYSDAYKQCMSDPLTADKVELNCIKEENIRILRQLDDLQKKIEGNSYFSGLASTGNTLSRQKENYQKYINSFCEYSARSECPDYRTPAVNKEECLFKFNSTLMEAWQDLLTAIQKKSQRRW